MNINIKKGKGDIMENILQEPEKLIQIIENANKKFLLLY